MQPDPFASSPPPPPASPPASPPPPPVAATSPPPPPPAAAAPSSAAGPGTSGLPITGGTPSSAAPAQPGQPGQNLPASVAQPTFEQQFRQRYNMDPSQAQMLMHLGYQQYQGQSRPGQPAGSVQATPAPAQENVFGLPAFDYRLLDFVQKGADGGLVLLPGAPPDAGIKVQTFQDQLRKVQQGFFENPMQYLEKPIAALVEKRAAEMYQQNFGQHQSQNAAQQIITENDSWLYSRDAAGQKQYVFDPSTGSNVPQLSPFGQYYQRCVNEIFQAGVRDPVAQHKYAIGMVEAAALRAKMQTQQAAPPGGNPAATQFLNSVAHPGQPAAPAPAASPAPAGQAPQPFSMRDRMLREFQANGITDEVLQRQLNRQGA